MKKITFLSLFLTTFLSFGQTNIIYETGFESSEEFIASTVYNNQSVIYFGPTDNQWGTYYGTASTTSALSGNQSMQMRWYFNSMENLGYTYTNFDLPNVHSVKFFAASTNGYKIQVSYSTDSGATYLGQQIFDLTETSAEYTYILPESLGTSPLRFKFQISLPEEINSSTQRLYLDDVKVFSRDEASTKENNIAGLNIFPNPADEVLNIISNSSSDKNVQLFDLTGKKVLDITTVTQVNVSTLKAGIYFAKINEKGKTDTRKIIIK